jgi:spermidine synthase
LIQRQFATTVVEIDPAIYDAAKEYFGFPSLNLADGDGHRIFLEDARAWTRKRRSAIKDTDDFSPPAKALDDATVEKDAEASLLFDVVIHDCFTGGGVPEHVFTVEFLDDLKAILRPHGVVAVVSFFLA